MGAQEKRTGNKREPGRNRTRVTRPRVSLTALELNMQHQVKHPLMSPWVAVSGYGMQLIHMQACTPRHIKSLQAILSCTFFGKCSIKLDAFKKPSHKRGKMFPCRDEFFKNDYPQWFPVTFTSLRSVLKHHIPLSLPAC